MGFLALYEQDRAGIGTFEPKDDENPDNLPRLDSRGESDRASRGLFEFIAPLTRLPVISLRFPSIPWVSTRAMWADSG
jgi:hypothetical protein